MLVHEVTPALALQDEPEVLNEATSVGESYVREISIRQSAQQLP